MNFFSISYMMYGGATQRARKVPISTMDDSDSMTGYS
jgi:hypothetical protein